VATFNSHELFMTKKLAGDRGEQLVLEELTRRGYKAVLKPRNHPVFDIECKSGVGTCFVVQVKNSTARNTQAWIGLTAVDRPLRTDLYFIVLRQWDSTESIPDFFVLTHEELKAAWNKMPVVNQRTGNPYKRTGHLAWEHLEPHLDGWAKLPN
jgi:hypothetical protein